MAEHAPGSELSGLQFDETVAATLHELLPRVAEQTVAAIIVDVPSYAGALSGRMGANIEAAVQMALGGFITLAGRADSPSNLSDPSLDTAYALGQGEARSDRTMDALLTAYRVGARVAWRELADAATAAGMTSGAMARFAELMFAYIDELSAASVAGHAAELSASSRERDRHLGELGRHLLASAGADVLVAAAERAEWQVPEQLTAVLLPAPQVRGALSFLGDGVLQPGEEFLDGLERAGLALLLVPDTEGRDRAQLLRVLAGRRAIIGPARPWMAARSSYLRAERAHTIGLTGDPSGVIDTELHLASLVLNADPGALADLRQKALAPLAGLRPATAEKLAATLHSWLLHQGRRDDVAADLFVHSQTVRYRMGQIRELYGDRLNNPADVLDLTIALHSLPS